MTDPTDPHELFTIRQAAAALGLPLDRVRRWVDAGVIDALQPAPHALRLIPARELHRLERVGFFVDYTRADRADRADGA